MPISKDEWEKGATTSSLKSRIENFLNQNKSQAYTIEEILHELYQQGDPVAGQMGSASQAQKDLNELIEESKVRENKVQTETSMGIYYIHT